jgi:FMN-dependent NADH-azoreductase
MIELLDWYSLNIPLFYRMYQYLNSATPNQLEMAMTKVLQINTSIHSEAATSSRLASEFTDALAERGAAVVTRDLAREPVPHLDAARFAAFVTKPEERTPDQQAVAAYSDGLIAEIRDADVVVIGLPMYNFGVPSQLKAYFDHIARAGATFRYTETGPVGLLTGKKGYVFATRGGVHAGTPIDTETAYVRDFLRFLGIGEVEFVYAEGLALGPAQREASVTNARAAIQNLAPPARLAA